MNDHFFNSYPGANFNRSKSQVNLNNIHRPSLFNLSGENIVYNKNNGLNKKKLSVKSYLKNDNLLAHKKLDEIKNEYHNMRNFLNDKVSKLEEQQQLQFENLRNYLQANNQIEKMKYEEKYKNNFLNEIKEQMDYDYNRKKKLEKLRNIAIAEKLGEKRYIEEMERKKLLQEMVYFKKIQHINRLERMLLQKNRMYKYYNANSQNLSNFISPLLFDYFNRNNNDNNQKHDELLKLILLKNLLNDETPKKDRPVFHRAPKYFIQKYYPPNEPTKLIPVPQPVFIQNPEQERVPYSPYQQPNIIIQKEPGEIITPNINIITRDARHRKKTDRKSTHKKHKHRHKHKHKHKQKHKKKNETPKSTEKKPELKSEEKEEKEEKEEEEEDEEEEEEEDDEEEEEEDENEKENEKPKEEQKKEEQKKPEKEKKQEKKEEEDEESSSQPDVRLKLVDPDNPEASRYVYPVNNQQ